MKKLSFLVFFCLNLTPYSQEITYNFEIAWTEQNSGTTASLNSVSTFLYYSDPRAAWVCGNNGTVLKTTNEGTTWFNVGINGIPANINLMNITMFSQNIAITSGRIGTTAYVYRTDDGGQSWTQVFSQESGFINGIYLSGFNFGFMQGNPVGGRWSLWKSSDLGETWDSTGLYLPQNNNESGWNNSFYTMNGYNGDRIWFGTNNQRVYYSANSGLSWVAQPISEQNIYSFSFIGANSVAGGSNLFISSNYGGLWNYESSLGSGNINGITVPPIIVITPSDNFIPSTPWLYIRSNNKIYYTDNGGGTSWEIKYQSASGSYNNIGSNGFNVWAVRNDGGITRGKIDVITSVIPNNYPYSFELFQNYPNPFNPKTKIPITVYKSTKLTLKVYNSAGKLITTLIDEYKTLMVYDNIPYGYYYEIEWDGTNYPSGIYFYQVIADDYKETRKMMLVK